MTPSQQARRHNASERETNDRSKEGTNLRVCRSLGWWVPLTAFLLTTGLASIRAQSQSTIDTAARGINAQAAGAAPVTMPQFNTGIARSSSGADLELLTALPESEPSASPTSRSSPSSAGPQDAPPQPEPAEPAPKS